MGDTKRYGSTNNLPGYSGEPEENGDDPERLVSTLRNRSIKWVSGIGGGLAGAIATFLFLILPSVNTWIANVKEVQLAQIKNSAEQIAYITKRMEDSDKERDLYKSEMLQCQKELRELKK